MKKSLLLFACAVVGCVSVYAQSFLSSYQQSFKGLNLQNSPVVRLLDLACVQHDISNTHGGLFADTGDIEIARELVRIMEQSKTNAKADINKWDSLLFWRNEYMKNGILPLVMIDATISELSDSFWINDRYSIDSDSNIINQLFPWKISDFVYHNIFYAVPMTNRLPANIHSVVLDPRFFFGNNTFNAVKLGIAINGTETILELGKITPIKGMLSGYNQCHIFLETSLTDNRFLNITPSITIGSRGRLATRLKIFNFMGIFNPLNIFLNKPIESFVVNTFIGNSNSIQKSSGALVTIHYSEKNKPKPGVKNCLHKPIVFIEGIDFGYEGYPSGCRDGKCGNTGYLDLLAGKQWNVDQQTFEDWPAIRYAPKILQAYRDSGFDIVFIDFFDGADYMEDNAKVVVDALKAISNRLCGNEIHVVGPSMGGLVAKNAIKMLENEPYDYCITSFTAFDAPLLGANIPISLQAMANYYSDIFGKAKDLKERMMNRPASRELLLMHYGQIDKPDPLHFTYFNNTTLQAYPIIPWKLSVTNGSNEAIPMKKIDGSKMYPGDLMLHINAMEKLKTRLKLLGTITGKLSIALVARLLPKTDAKLFAYAASMKGAPAGKGVAAVFESSYIKDKTWFVNASTDGLDHQPGGMNAAISTFIGITKKTLGIVTEETMCENTCFIPVWSALESTKVQSRLNSPLYETLGEGFLTTNNTPFDDYYAQSKNQDHIFFDSSINGNAFWLLNKIIKLGTKPTITVEKITFYGDLYDRFLNGVEILKGGVFQINHWEGKTPISEKNALILESQKSRNFYIGNCRAAQINIKQNGQMIVGSGKSKNQKTVVLLKPFTTLNVEPTGTVKLADKTAMLRIGNQSMLLLQDNSSLIIEDGSQLILEEGGTMYIGKNVTIKLNGKDALLHIKGKLILDSFATVSVISDKGNLTGLLKFSNIGQGFGLFEIKGGGHAKFIAKGNNKDVSPVLQFEGAINTSQIFDSTLISRAAVKFGNNSIWQTTGLLNIEDSEFSPTEWANKNTSGIKLLSGKTQINRSHFKQLLFGIQIQDSVNKHHIHYCEFTKCNTGILAYQAGISAENCTFKENNIGIEFGGSKFLDSIFHCSFFNHKIAGALLDGNLSQKNVTTFNECGFYKNDIGINTNGAIVGLGCSVFGYNSRGVSAYKTTLVLGNHSGIKHGSDTLICGNNTFAQNTDLALKVDNGQAFLDGENNFIVSKSKPNNYIQISITLQKSTSDFMWNIEKSKINVGKNHFQPIDFDDDIDSMDLKFFEIQKPTVGYKNSPIHVTGELNKTIFTECFNPMSTLSSAMRIAGFDENKMGELYTTHNPLLRDFETGNINIPQNAKVFSLLGAYITNTNQFNWANEMSEGIYLIQWKGNNGQIHSRKIMVTKQ